MRTKKPSAAIYLTLFILYVTAYIAAPAIIAAATFYDAEQFQTTVLASATAITLSKVIGIIARQLARLE